MEENMGKQDWEKEFEHKETEAKQDKPKVKDDAPYTEITVTRPDPRIDALDRTSKQLIEELGKLKGQGDYTTFKADVETMKIELEAIKAILGTTVDIAFCEKCGVPFSIWKALKDINQSWTTMRYDDKPDYKFECPICHKKTDKLTIRSTGETIKAKAVRKKLEAAKLEKESSDEESEDTENEE
jgi:hypothetical protein